MMGTARASCEFLCEIEISKARRKQTKLSYGLARVVALPVVPRAVSHSTRLVAVSK